jgi:hypothetical protein
MVKRQDAFLWVLASPFESLSWCVLRCRSYPSVSARATANFFSDCCAPAMRALVRPRASFSQRNSGYVRTAHASRFASFCVAWLPASYAPIEWQNGHFGHPKLFSQALAKALEKKKRTYAVQLGMSALGQSGGLLPVRRKE